MKISSSIFLQNILLIGTLFLIVACNRPAEVTAIDFLNGQPAQWLQDDRPLPIEDSLFYQTHPAPLFRKVFKTEQPIQAAQLLITAAGYYRASINGKVIGNNVLDPAWTDFSKRIYYSEYEVGDLLQEGDNCLGVSLGNGFYNPLPMRKWGRRNLRKDLAKVGKPVFIAKLIVSYENGEVEEIVSDDSWKFNYGPLQKNSVYLGVVYDARKELGAWNTPEYDDQDWQQAKIGVAPGGLLQKAFFPPVQVTKEIAPTNIYPLASGGYLVDMGVNFTGTFKMKLSGKEGDTIRFRFGERIYEDGSLNPMTAVIGQIKRPGVGGPGAPPIAWQRDTYIMAGNKTEWFQPDFTYHTYRYMEILGLKQAPAIEDIRGLMMHSNVPNNNEFACSSELLNEIQTATERTFLTNLISVQSDCPAREKFGYGGDINATSESFIYNFDMQDFYRKTIYDWVDAMNDSTFVDTAPFVGIQYCGLSWESAFLITQYYLYLYYHDLEIVQEMYELDKAWMEKAARLHPAGTVDKGLSDHESLEPVPVALTGTGHYLQCARIMATFSELMGDAENQKKYTQLAEDLAQKIKAQFWEQAVQGPINRQTLFATLLYHEIIPESDLGAAVDSLRKAVKNGPAGHFNTGIFGTKYVLEALSKYGTPEEVFAIVNSREYPGWGHMIDRGATTIWETWKESDNTFSNNHPMFGTVTEWYYRYLGGIQPIAEHPSFEEFRLAPSMPTGLDWVRCTYHTPNGPIVSNWEKLADGSLEYQLSIPEGSSAQVKLPMKASQSILIESPKEGFDFKSIAGVQEGDFKLSTGTYLIKIQDESLD